MRKVIIIFTTILLIYAAGVSHNAYANRQEYFKERMKNVKKIAALPIDYELIVPSPKDLKRQREGFSEEETKEERESLLSQATKLLKEYTEDRRYEFIYVNPKDKQGDIKNIINKIKSIRKNIAKEWLDRKKAFENEPIIINGEIKNYVKDLNLSEESDVFLVILCRERIATGGGALAAHHLGFFVHMAASKTWKDEYIGYVSSPDYTYIDVFIINSETLQLIKFIRSIVLDNAYYNHRVLNGMLHRMTWQLPKRKRTKSVIRTQNISVKKR